MREEITKMFYDDFDLQIQSDEIIPEEYDDWCRWMYAPQEED